MKILNDDMIRTTLRMASRHLPADGKRAETIYALLYEMFPELDYNVSFKTDVMNLGTSQVALPVRITLSCNGMPVNMLEEVATFLLAHGKSEQEAEATVLTLKFFLSVGV